MENIEFGPVAYNHLIPRGSYGKIVKSRQGYMESVVDRLKDGQEFGPLLVKTWFLPSSGTTTKVQVFKGGKMVYED